MTFFVLFFPTSGYLGTPNTAQQGKTQNDKSALLCHPTVVRLGNLWVLCVHGIWALTSNVEQFFGVSVVLTPSG